ncbi:hypothetical protein C1703_37010 [Streptomyces sp. Go-475]|nr:hypothetical protein C1703_37010 [Streptomyces sp. Go-475]
MRNKGQDARKVYLPWSIDSCERQWQRRCASTIALNPPSERTCRRIRFVATPSPSAAPAPFRDAALPMSKRVDDLLDPPALDERLALLHQYVPAVPRLGVASFRTGTEALRGVAWLGGGDGLSPDRGARGVMGRGTGTRRRRGGLGRGARLPPAPADLDRIGHQQPPDLGARGEPAARSERAAPVLKHFLTYDDETDRCVTSSGLRPRVLVLHSARATQNATARSTRPPTRQAPTSTELDFTADQFALPSV